MDSGPVLQKPAENPGPRGRLDPGGFDRNVTFRTAPPGDGLLPFVEHFWSLRWDREGAPPYVSRQVMHRPYVDLYFGAEGSGVQCTFRGTRDYLAAGQGRIVGARFLPGAFHAFWGRSLAGLADQSLALQRVFEHPPSAETLLVLDDAEAFDRMSQLLLSAGPRPDPNVELVSQIVSAVETGKYPTVASVARAFLRSERWVQQLFSEYLGVGLKWLLQRRRLLTVAATIRGSVSPDWADLGYAAGYSSQQHFISAFKAALGLTPLEYWRSLSDRNEPGQKNEDGRVGEHVDDDGKP